MLIPPSSTLFHLNQVVYYSWFDTCVNTFLIEQAGLDIHRSEVIGVCVESSCRYTQSLSFPTLVEVGLYVSKLGNSSVRYDLAIFEGKNDSPSAHGYFVHVFVEREKNKPVPIPPGIKIKLAELRA
eukprot:TRINITY_DN11630_c0_g1_i1.p1 TRINITY_DN11630_c0_g1~~TRINITY_DN11630_c0_g1_i1.p1  ORF type:complete len:126 (+),score=16.62 TRINITY_DN11630_c0_g1_i1:43-420(+)